MINVVFYSLLIAATSFFYEFCLRDGMILEKWRRFLELKLPLIIAKPLGYCIFCFNMQLAVWSMLIVCISGNCTIIEGLASALFSHIILVHLITKYS